MENQLSEQQLNVLGQAFARMQAEKLAAAQAAQGPVFRRHPRTGLRIEEGWGTDSMKAFGSGLAQGVIGLAGLPGDLERLKYKGFNLVGQQLGLPEQPVNKLQTYPTGEALRKQAKSYFGPFYQARTTPGRHFQTIGEYAPGVFIPGGQLRTAAQIGGHVLKSTVAPAVAAQFAYDRAPDNYKDAAKAVTGLIVGHFATQPSHVDKLLSKRVTPAASKTLEASGPYASLYEASDGLTKMANRTMHQGGKNADILLDAVTNARINQMRQNPVRNLDEFSAQHQQFISKRDDLLNAQRTAGPVTTDNLTRGPLLNRTPGLVGGATGGLAVYVANKLEAPGWTSPLVLFAACDVTKKAVNKAIELGPDKWRNRTIANALGLQDSARDQYLAHLLALQSRAPALVTAPARGILSVNDARTE